MIRSLPFVLLSTVVLGSATAQALQQVTPATASTGLVSSYLADFDGSGRPDLLYMSWGNLEAVFDPDLSTATYTPTVLVPSGTLGSPIFSATILHAVADANGDSTLDLIVSYYSSFGGGSTLYLVPGTGNGTVGTPVPIFSGYFGYVVGMQVADFDGDTDNDLLMTLTPVGLPTRELRLYTQDPTGFTQAHSENVYSERVLSMGDFNGDGLPDATIKEDYGTARLFLGSSTGFAPTTQLTIPATADEVRSAGDLNGDGRDDALATRRYDTELTVMWGDAAAGLVIGPALLANGSSIGSQLGSPRGLDFDADGHLDIVAAASQPGNLVLFRGDGAGNLSSPPATMPLIGNGSVQWIDLDDDGDSDLLDSQNNGTFERFENRAHYGFACAGVAGDPTLSVGAALPGNSSFAIGLDNAAPGALAQIIIALDGAAAPCGPQVNLGAVLFPMSAPIFAMITDAGGSATLPLPIPINAPIGPYFLQAAVFDAQGAWQGSGLQLAATRGRAIEVF